MRRFALCVFTLSLLTIGGAACTSNTGGNHPVADDDDDDVVGDDDDDATASPSPTPSGPLSLIVVTFNTGTSEGMGHDSGPDDGYTSQHAATSDQYYGDGLAWTPAVEAAKTFFAEAQPDLVGFQEIFYAGLCPTIPDPQKIDFYCETWQPGDPTVASYILGDGYQVMCHPGKDDKCTAVKKTFGTFQGCDEDFCLEGLTGLGVDGCGSGARTARAIIDLADGGQLTHVNYHGTSGITTDDQNCRVQQIDQVFVDVGDGSGPLVGESNNVITGDLNTDPGRLAGFDASAAHWLDFVNLPGTQDAAFSFVTEVGDNATPTYSNLFNIDHVMSDVGTGSCWVAGIDGNDPVTDAKYFDHMPVVCEVEMPHP